MRKLRKFQEYLDESLKNPIEAGNYLNAAYEEGEDVFLVALHDVAQAHGMTTLAKSTGLQREGLYKMLSKKGNPEYRSLRAILDSIGLSIEFRPKKAA